MKPSDQQQAVTLAGGEGTALTLVSVDILPTDQNPAAVYLAGLSEGGRRTMRQVLGVVAGMLGAEVLTLDWGAMRYQHVAAIRARLQEQYQAATVNKTLAAIRGVLKAAWRLGYMSAEDYQKAVSVEGVTGSTLPAGRDLGQGEILALMNACAKDDSPAGIRDAALIALLYAGGLRRAEVVSLALGDYDTDTGKLIITGKGNKQRSVYLTNGAAEAMADWLALRGTDGSALFVSINRGGHLDTSKHMTDQAIYGLLQKRAAEAGVKTFSPHDMRRSFVSDMLAAGADIATVAKLAGHANVQTTARYDRRGEEAKKEAAKMLHVPYRRRDG